MFPPTLLRTLNLPIVLLTPQSTTGNLRQVTSWALDVTSSYLLKLEFYFALV